MPIYKQFSEYVISTFHKREEYVSLVIDEKFMADAAQCIGCSQNEIIRSISNNLFDYLEYPFSDNLSIIAVVAIQLYAASIRVNDVGDNIEDIAYTAEAYNPRLAELIDKDKNFLRRWYEDHQDHIWTCFYEFCKKEGLLIQELQIKSGKGRYTQYPLTLAKYTFNREDLKYIASVFAENKIEPYENIEYKDFWRIFNIKRFNVLSNRINRILISIFDEQRNYDIAKSQIYSYFLAWDGKYKDPYTYQGKSVHNQKNKAILHLKFREGVYSIDAKNIDGDLIENYHLNSQLYKAIKLRYHFKRENTILFQEHDIYPNVWNEVRYISDKSKKGVIIYFQDQYRNNLTQLPFILTIGNISIYEVEYSKKTANYYSQDAPLFEFHGGLKIAKSTYLNGGCPVLRLTKACSFLYNGKLKSVNEGNYNLKLPIGEHTFKFPRSREVSITISPPAHPDMIWKEDYTKWKFSRKESIWTPRYNSIGAVGLDFSTYATNKTSTPILQQWAESNRKKNNRDTSNLSIKILNNLNRYE